MKIRSARLRTLAVLPVLLLAALGLTGCDSKAGTAAVIDGHRISEKELSSYLPANGKPIQSGDGSTSTPAKYFVLQYLVRNQVFPLVLAAAGAPVTDAQLQAGRAEALSGTTEAELTAEITKAGLPAKFEPVFVRNRELLNLLRAKLTTDKQINDALAKVKNKVSVNPRYGSWNDSNLSLTDLSAKQLPSVLTLDSPLPGDTAPTQK